MPPPNTTTPPTMKAWQWTTCTTTLDAALHLHHTAPLPTAHRALAAGESLIRIHFAALNPIDYKIAQLPIIGRLAIRKPATPGLDFSGEVVDVGADSDVKIGQRVFGKLEPKQQFGTLAEYTIGSRAGTVAVPAGVSMQDAATLGVCGLVTYQCLAPHVAAGERVLINGGSGGTGTFAIQIAKALGCWVTATCSGANEQLCRDLGADEVLDYGEENVSLVLQKQNAMFDAILDNVGSPLDLYWKSPGFTTPSAKYIQIGSQVSLAFMYDLAFRFMVPTWLGGGQRPFAFALTSTNRDDFIKLAEMVRAGKIKPVIDEVVEFEHVKRGYEKLSTGRVKGKIVVRVCGKE